MWLFNLIPSEVQCLCFCCCSRNRIKSCNCLFLLLISSLTLWTTCLLAKQPSPLASWLGSTTTTTEGNNESLGGGARHRRRQSVRKVHLSTVWRPPNVLCIFGSLLCLLFHFLLVPNQSFLSFCSAQSGTNDKAEIKAARQEWDRSSSCEGHLSPARCKSLSHSCSVNKYIASDRTGLVSKPAQSASQRVEDQKDNETTSVSAFASVTIKCGVSRTN